MYVATPDILTEKGGFNPQTARAIGEAIDLEIVSSISFSGISSETVRLQVGSAKYASMR
jgi:hypothetical protein